MELFTYVMLYHWYKSVFAVVIRVLFFLSIGAFFFLQLHQGMFPKIPLFFLSGFLIIEVFYRFKVIRAKPIMKVTDNTKNLYLSFTFQALDCFFFAANSVMVIKNMLNDKSINYIMRRSGLHIKDIIAVNIPKQTLAHQAFMTVKAVGGSYVTRMDLFAAYILLCEQQTKALMQRHLQAEEFMQILYWARMNFPEEENPNPRRAVFLGEGIFDSISTGWTNETNKYIFDVTSHALAERPSVLGYKKEFQQLVATLARKEHNNVLIVGPTGVGKRSFVEAFALNSYIGLLPKNLYHKRVYQLLVGLLVAGANTTGELEERLEMVIQEILHAGNIIMYIESLENILGSDTFHANLSAALVPYLKNHSLPIVATISPETYKTYLSSAREFLELFDVIELREPTVEDAKIMLLEKAQEIEQKNNVSITYRAIIRAVELSHKFIQDHVLPGSAVTLLNRVVGACKQAGRSEVQEADVVKEVEALTRVSISEPGSAERQTLLHLEEELHKRVIGQDEAVSSVSRALQRLRAGVEERERPISFLFLGPTGVGKTETAKTLARIYFGGEDRIIRLDMSEYTGSDSMMRLLGAMPGQGEARGELTEKIAENPFSLVLLDEFEKANPQVMDMFLQVLDDGRLTDNRGKKVSFANAIIIATSNAGALTIEEQLRANKPLDDSFHRKLIEKLEEDRIFKPELLNRFDGIVVFHSLDQAQLQSIAQIYMHGIADDLAKIHEVKLVCDPTVFALIAQKGFDIQFGARPLRRFIQDTIENLLAKLILQGVINRGDGIKLFVGPDGNIGWSKLDLISSH